MSGAPVVIESDALRVTVHPAVGGTIAAIAHKVLGASILGTVPWQPDVTPLDSGAAPDEPTWLTRYGGGWPLLFPNGGDACEFAGVFHGFHGEASISPWHAAAETAAVTLTRKFRTVPAEMRRVLTVDRDLLTIRETLRMGGPQPVQVMWGHHPTFGSDLLAAPFEIQSGARTVTVDDRFDPPGNPLRPGVTARWPTVAGKSGPFDLGRPAGRIAAVAYLQDWDGPWVSIRRLDDFVAAVLSWDAAVFPFAWLWYELGGTDDPPWRGQARLIGIEPNTTWPGNGLADAARRAAPLLTLQPGAEVEATVRLHAFKPTGRVHGVDPHGRAISNTTA